MPKYVKASTDHVSKVDLVVGSELVTPDDGAVSVTVLDTDGFAISGHVDQPATVPENGTSASYLIPSAANTLPSGGAGYRFVEFKFLYNEQPYTLMDQYELVTRTMLPVTPSDVRSKLGVLASELADAEIDIVGTYRKLQNALTAIDFDALFTSGGYELTHLNKLLVASAALSVLPSLQLRVTAKEQVDNTIWQRLAKIDFDLLRDQLQAEVDDETFNLTADDGTGSLVIALLAQGTDAVTGAEA